MILSLHEGRIVLNRAEQRRVSVLNHLDSGALVNSEAAQLLGYERTYSHFRKGVDAEEMKVLPSQALSVATEWRHAFQGYTAGSGAHGGWLVSLG